MVTRSLDKYSPPEILDGLCQKLLANRITALVYVSDDTYSAQKTASAQYLIKMANFLGIPVISWIGDNSGIVQPSSENTILQLTPSISHQCRAILDLLQRYNWHAFSIVTGTLAGQDHFINVLRDLADQSSVYNYDILSVIKISTPTHSVIKRELERLKSSDTRVILFYASKEEAEVIFPHADSVGLTSKEYIWVACKAIIGDAGFPAVNYPVGLLATDFETSFNSQLNAVNNAGKIWLQGMENLYRASKNDSNLQNISLIPPMRNCSGDMGRRWDVGQRIMQFMKETVVSDSLRFEADGTLTNTEVEIHNLKKDKKFKKIGTWNTEEGLEMNDITWPGESPTPPKGLPSKYHMRVVTLEEKPYVVYSDPDPRTGSCPPQSTICRVAPLNDTIHVANATSNSSLYKCCSGLCIDLLMMLSEKISFEFDLFQVEDKKWGAYVKETGQWNGLIRTIMDGKADMVMTSLKITPERNQQIDFSVPFLETGITILVAVRDGVISPTAFLEPFDILSWMFILVVCMHIVALAIWIFEWISPNAFDLKTTPPPEHRFSLFRSFWLIWAMLFGAAVNVDNPRGVSSRFLANIWALFAVVFTASYTANLAAFMITKEDYDRLSGIQDWRLTNPHAHKPAFKFATVPHGSTETNLMKNYWDMYQYMKPFNKSNVQDGVTAVKSGEINAFIYDATVLEYLASHDDSCKLRTVGNWYAMTGYGIGLPVGSKWLPIINKYMVQFQYDGEMERLQKFWLAGACKKNDNEGESSMPLGILNFTSAFILLAGGMLLGGFLLLLEHTYFKFFRSKLRKWDKCGCCGLVSLSMGKSLTFEQSVREAIELQKHYRCKNPICETQTWKLNHELDLALLKIERLSKQVGENGAIPTKGAIMPKAPPSTVRKRAQTKQPISCRNNGPHDEMPQIEKYPATDSEDGVTEPLLERPPPFGWAPEVLEPSDHEQWPPDTVAAPPYVLAVDEANYPSSALGAPLPPRPQKRTSKSLPNSPMKKSHTIPSMPPDDLGATNQRDNLDLLKPRQNKGENKMEKETVL
ncbi:hypothetical protein CAPTEDRAFT_179505 [Capitella teleta]|uniref:Glutamate receptor ionotropic, NMDA 2B n=1 Tax=Capitella teleta TaxID=283909 RepID=R7UYQ1_CAPTE|nr:hypothetical protein CAPTEDRAFT_179505 [Capitella teleta]|eukprot:ELU11683.1 hypothetical protein CAPTEDRAFT_179505 [Capitella teleta]